MRFLRSCSGASLQFGWKELSGLSQLCCTFHCGATRKTWNELVRHIRFVNWLLEHIIVLFNIVTYWKESKHLVWGAICQTSSAFIANRHTLPYHNHQRLFRRKCYVRCSICIFSYHGRRDEQCCT